MAAPLTAGARLRRAVNGHQAGRLSDAERIHREILARDPGHCDSLHPPGVLLHQRGDSEGGLRLAEHSLKRQGQFLTSLNCNGLMLGRPMRYEVTSETFNLAIKLNPAFAAAGPAAGAMAGDPAGHAGRRGWMRANEEMPVGSGS
jgi:hypothetical protein